MLYPLFDHGERSVFSWDLSMIAPFNRCLLPRKVVRNTPVQSTGANNIRDTYVDTRCGEMPFSSPAVFLLWEMVNNMHRNSWAPLEGSH